MMVIRDDFDKSTTDLKTWKTEIYEDVQRFLTTTKQDIKEMSDAIDKHSNQNVSIQIEMA